MNRTSRKHRTFLFRALAILLGLLPFGVAELALRWLDWPASRQPVDPFVDLHHLKPLFEPASDNHDLMQIGSDRLHLFQPTQFRKTKREGVVRVFALGGSTTQGEPYATETAFPHWFELALESITEQDVEVINCGGLSYASYRVLAILREVLAYEPDLLVVYTGHNEFLEDRSYAGLDVDNVALQAQSWLRQSRLVQAVKYMVYGNAPSRSLVKAKTTLATEVEALLDYQGGLEVYHRSSALQSAVTAHFRWNLSQMIQDCKSAGVPLVLIGPVSNLKKCPPFKMEVDPRFDSEKRKRFQGLWQSARSATSEALAEATVRRALTLDPDHAGANYLLGQILLETSPAVAKQHLLAAKNCDVCPLRATSPIVSAVRELSKQKGCIYLDAEQVFASRSRDEIVGDRWLVDHIHPTVEGHQILALELARSCIRAGLFRDAPGWEEATETAFSEDLSELGEAYFQRGKQRLEGLLLWTQGRAQKIRPEESTVSTSELN